MSDSKAHQSYLIVGGGLSPGAARLIALSSRYDAIVAADSGLLTIRDAQLVPVMVTGDFDSLTPGQLAVVPESDRMHNSDQSTTDLEKAIQWALEAGGRHIGLAAVTGSRIDHTFNAASLMLRYKAEADFTLHDENGDAKLAFAPGVTISGKPGEKLSLIPAPGAMGVNSTGLKYTLDGIDLVFGARDGISNELLVAEARLTFKSGSLLVYRFLSQGPAPC